MILFLESYFWKESMDLVVKDNSLINASYSLSLVEQRLILLAIIEARETEQGIDSESFLEVHAQHYADRFDIQLNNSYSILSDASQSLFNRQVTYTMVDEKRNKPEKRVVRWVSGISYVEGSGVVKLRFSPEVVPLITRLEKNFTSYELEQVKNLNSYATRLYEMLISWRSVGKVKITLLELRQRLGLENEYQAMSDFKKRVLDISLQQINEHTDIIADYEQHKHGRTITGFTFKFKQKTNPKTVKSDKIARDLNTVDMFITMTDNQRFSFAKKISQLHEASHLAKGLSNQSYEAFAEQISKDLLDRNKQNIYLPFLEKLGFQSER